MGRRIANRPRATVRLGQAFDAAVNGRQTTEVRIDRAIAVAEALDAFVARKIAMKLVHRTIGALVTRGSEAGRSLWCGISYDRIVDARIAAVRLAAVARSKRRIVDARPVG